MAFPFSPEKALADFLRDVGSLYGLPVLPSFEYRLFESQSAPPAARRLAFAIEEVFGQEQAQREASSVILYRFPEQFSFRKLSKTFSPPSIMGFSIKLNASSGACSRKLAE